MRNLIYFVILGFFIYSCSTTRNRDLNGETGAVGDTIRIANDSLEYEILIIDPGFSYFLNALAKPEGYHSQSYLENKNQFLVTDYNQRVRMPFRYDSGIYTQAINYDASVDYGYEVNYKLYNYFAYLAWKYGERFSVPVRH